MSLILLLLFLLLLLLHIIILIILLLIFVTRFGVTAPVEIVHATTPATCNGFDTSVPNFLASFAPLLLLHTMTLLQQL